MSIVHDTPVPAREGGEFWGSDPIAAVLRELEIPYIALVPGSSYRGLHDSIVNYLGNRTPQMVLTIHEENAVAIAHGYAKASGRMMAAALHANIGLMHAAMAVYNAWCDRAPLLIFGATGPWDASRRRPWIDWIHTSADQGGLVRNFTKWDNQPGSVAAATEAVLRAAQIALTAPRGPVYVNLEVTMQEGKLEAMPPLPDAKRYAVRRRSAPRRSSSRRRRNCSRARRTPSSSPGAAHAASRAGRRASRSRKSSTRRCSATSSSVRLSRPIIGCTLRRRVLISRRKRGSWSRGPT